jgi:aspartyl/asparaginyl-tRNA synthetase
MGLHGFVSVYDLGPEFSAEAQIFSNQLFWDFMYLEADMSREEANAIVEEIKSILKAALQNYLK